MSREVRFRSLFKKRGNKGKEIAQDAGVGEGDSQGRATPMESYGLFPFPERAREAQREHNPVDVDARPVDIIAVHGLGGSWMETWTATPSGAIWLRDRLPQILTPINVHPRVLAFGYDSAYIFSTSHSDIDDCARSLLNRIQMARVTDESKKAPIIFIAHSMGALVVQQAINIAHTDQEYFDDVLTNARGFVFLASPLHGSDAAWWAKIGSQVLKALTVNTVGNSSYPTALKRNSKVWLRISRDFVQRGKNLTFRSFYETERIAGQIIVDEASARLNWPNEKVFPLPGSNHRTICKFAPEEDQRFGPVGHAVLEVIQKALKVRAVDQRELHVELLDMMLFKNERLASALLVASDLLLEEQEALVPSEVNSRVISDLPVSTPTFFGRSAEMEEISTTLDPNKAGMKGIILYGIGGAGKTQLILHYIQQTKDKYDAIFWIDSQTQDQVLNSFADADALISKSWRSKDLPNPSTGNNVRLRVLSRLRSTLYRNWLLILDSADDPGKINYLEIVPQECQHGSIIISSTMIGIVDIFQPCGFSGIEIDVLDPKSSTELLIRKAMPALDLTQVNYRPEVTQDISKIAKELNFIPLALEHGAMLLRKKVLRPDNFISQYRTRYEALMGHVPKRGDVLHRTRSMSILFGMLYSYIEKESPGAAHLLQFLAILGPSTIPVSIIVHLASYKVPGLTSNNPIIHMDEVSTRSSLVFLEDICLLKMKSTTDGFSQSLQIHRSICQWVMSMVKADQESRILFTALGVGDFQCSQKLSLDWPMCKPYGDSQLFVPMIDRMLSKIEEFKPPKEMLLPGYELAPLYFRVARDFGYVYFCQGRYQEAKALLSEAECYQDASKVELRGDSVDILPIVFCLATTHYKLGELAEASKYFKAAKAHANNDAELHSIDRRLDQVTERLRVFQHHHDSAVTGAQGHKLERRSTQGYDAQAGHVHLGESGDEIGAQPQNIRMLERWIEVRRNSVPLSDPERLWYEDSLARAYFNNREYAKAIKGLKPIIAVLEETLPAKDMNRLDDKFLLAIAYYYNEQYIEAIEVLNPVVTICREILPAGDPKRLRNEFVLAMAYLHNEQYIKVIELSKSVVAVRQETLPAEDPKRLDCETVLAMAYLQNEQYIEAIELFKPVVAVLREMLRAGDPKRLECEFYLSTAYCGNGQYAEAFQILEPLVAIRREILPACDPDRKASEYLFTQVYREL
ncbi:hypothetical protein EKO27_g7132 [Xylaria grammica]|uniref:NB-ARC domain-containing protein n=1 Tax=Xylaria grammica TaxID=363999 RepID=A0A439D159_9PEZI|nr:hypothetical protein EKO27_g7132 [Xylaria grammica]